MHPSDMKFSRNKLYKGDIALSDQISDSYNASIVTTEENINKGESVSLMNIRINKQIRSRSE